MNKNYKFGGRHVTGYSSVLDDPWYFGGRDDDRDNVWNSNFGGAPNSRDAFNNNLKTVEVRRFANVMDQLDGYEPLRTHQNNPCKYLDQYHKQLRGFMLTHEMGTGKTPTAVFALDVLKKHYPDRKILVIAPKALHQNFTDTIVKFQKHLRFGPNEVAYVSSNASNFFDQLMVAHTTPQRAALYKKNKASFVDEKLFDNFIVIVDEAHNLFSNIANAKHVIKRSEAQLSEFTQAERVYNLILAADDPKIVYMSGTPIANTPFEFAIATNMIKGWVTTGRPGGQGRNDSGSSNNNRTTIFPEEHSKFNEYFINETGVGMKNMKEFQSRIYGIGSFYGKDYYNEETKALFPTFSRNVEYVTMGELQFKRYMIKAIELEGLKMQRKGDFKLEVERWEKERDLKYADAQFRISLRQIANVFTPPGYEAESYGKLPVKEKEKIAKHFLEDIQSYSPKILKLVEHLEASSRVKTNQEGQQDNNSNDLVTFPKTVIYSHFTTTIEFIRIYLRHKGIKFGTVTGDDSAEERAQSVRQFNDPKSGYDVMIISSAGAEGLDLKGVRYVHILEPQYNLNRIEQVETRGVRFMSHSHLPENERHVEIYLYVCIFGKYNLDSLKEEASATQIDYILGKPSVDADLYQKSIQKKKTYNDLINCIKRSAVDCYNYRPENECINAKMINKPLYELNIPYDISINGFEMASRVNETKSMMRLYPKGDSGISFVFKRDKRPNGVFFYEPIAKFEAPTKLSDGGVSSAAAMNEARFNLDAFEKKPEAYNAVFYEQDIPLVDETKDLVKTDRDYWGQEKGENLPPKFGGGYGGDDDQEDGPDNWVDSTADW